MIDYYELLKNFIKALMKETGSSQISQASPSLTKEESCELAKIFIEIKK